MSALRKHELRLFPALELQCCFLLLLQLTIGVMSTVAEQLRTAREARNLTVEQVAEITKMRTDYVRALEEGNYKAFSAPVYVRGFVRTYSRLLKLDEAPILTALDSEIGRFKEFSEEPGGLGHKQGIVDFVTLQLSKLGWRNSLIVLTVVVVLFAMVLTAIDWKKGRAGDPLQDLEPGVYKSPTNTVEILPLSR